MKIVNGAKYVAKVSNDKEHAVILNRSIKVRVDNVTPKVKIINSGRGPQGPQGAKGETPVKGVDYFDGIDGYNPLTVSATEPSDPQEGDLWYQP